jgi:hypothetical protein
VYDEVFVDAYRVLGKHIGTKLCKVLKPSEIRRMWTSTEGESWDQTQKLDELQLSLTTDR